MVRYIAKPLSVRPPTEPSRSWWHEPWSEEESESTTFPSLQVYDSPDEVEFTGVLDADGDPIYRERRRIGFIWHDEDGNPES